MKNKLKGIIVVFFVLSYASAMAQPTITRKDLLHVLIREQAISNVDIKEVCIPAGQSSPKHAHPCPVVGYVAAGKILFQVEGEEKKIIEKGDAFYEPKNKPILHFDNASPTEPLVFIAFYLKEGNEAIVELLK